MHVRQILLALIVVLVTAALSLGQEPKWRPSQNYGLQGPIHTQIAASRKLTENPPATHTLFIRQPQGWLMFDPVGNVIESASVDESGNLVAIVRNQIEGRPGESTITQDGITKHLRVETHKLSASGTELLTYIDGNLSSRSLSSYDPQTGAGETEGFDGAGQMTSHSISHKGAGRSESEVWGANGKFFMHYVVRYDQRKELIESVRYDAEGRVVSDISFKDGVLTSWWQDPKCECVNSTGGFNQSDGSTVSYKTTKEGQLLKTVQHHEGRSTNFENDDEELYDETGQLLERIAYSYERDQYGNWTKRVVSVLDKPTGEMVPVREDTRVLTYY